MAEDARPAEAQAAQPDHRVTTGVFTSTRTQVLMVAAAIIIATFAVYYFSRPDPIKWYDHHLFLADALLNGTFDLSATGIPDFYQDTVLVGDAKYLPYGPVPAVLLMPLVAIWGTDGLTQIYFSMALGAINVALFWYILRLLPVGRVTQLLMVPFFALGTVHFYSATTGTLWFYNHVSAVFFVLIAVILLLRRAPVFLPAIALAFAVLCRGPTLLAAPFFVWVIVQRLHEDLTLRSLLDFSYLRSLVDRRTVRDIALFAAPLVACGLFILWYNYVRFDDPLDSGYQTVYEGYNGLYYSFWQGQRHFLQDGALAAGEPIVAPLPVVDPPRFGLLDPRNVPLHLHALFMIPPNFYPDWSIYRPSPYGLSILFTSPAFIYAFFVKRKTAIKTAAWISIALICIPLFLHYSQGWVQYGYRFLLDFAPFLLILTALGFDDNPSPRSRRIQVALVTLSVVAGVWGRYWGNEFGW